MRNFHGIISISRLSNPDWSIKISGAWIVCKAGNEVEIPADIYTEHETMGLELVIAFFPIITEVPVVSYASTQKPLGWSTRKKATC